MEYWCGEGQRIGDRDAGERFVSTCQWDKTWQPSQVGNAIYCTMYMQCTLYCKSSCASPMTYLSRYLTASGPNAWSRQSCPTVSGNGQELLWTLGEQSSMQYVYSMEHLCDHIYIFMYCRLDVRTVLHVTCVEQVLVQVRLLFRRRPRSRIRVSPVFLRRHLGQSQPSALH